MRFYLDEDQSHHSAAAGRVHFVLDVVASHELRLDHTTDEEQLRFAASQNRCLVTKNDRDFAALTDQFVRHALPHAGVLIVPNSIRSGEFMRIARALAWFNALYPEGVPPYFYGCFHDPSDDWTL
jgi:predicted nuclease of predicted toxin-antitoxin system